MTAPGITSTPKRIEGPPIGHVLGVGAIALLLGCVFAVAGYFAYRNWRADSVQLQTTLGTQQQVISAAQQGEQAREKQLTSTLGQIAMLKQRTRTPEGVFFEEI